MDFITSFSLHELSHFKEPLRSGSRTRGDCKSKTDRCEYCRSLVCSWLYTPAANTCLRRVANGRIAIHKSNSLEKNAHLSSRVVNCSPAMPLLGILSFTSDVGGVPLQGYKATDFVWGIPPLPMALDGVPLQGQWLWSGTPPMPMSLEGYTSKVAGVGCAQTLEKTPSSVFGKGNPFCVEELVWDSLTSAVLGPAPDFPIDVLERIGCSYHCLLESWVGIGVAPA